MTLLEKCIKVVSNLNRSIAIDCKITGFNLQPFNQILLIIDQIYQSDSDQDILAWAAYMKQIKKYASVMSNLSIGVYQLDSKAVKFNLPSSNKLFQEAANWIISPAKPPGIASIDGIYGTNKVIYQNCERLKQKRREVNDYL